MSFRRFETQIRRTLPGPYLTPTRLGGSDKLAPALGLLLLFSSSHCFQVSYELLGCTVQPSQRAINIADSSYAMPGKAGCQGKPG